MSGAPVAGRHSPVIAQAQAKIGVPGTGLTRRAMPAKAQSRIEDLWTQRSEHPREMGTGRFWAIRATREFSPWHFAQTAKQRKVPPSYLAKQPDLV